MKRRILILLSCSIFLFSFGGMTGCGIQTLPSNAGAGQTETAALSASADESEPVPATAQPEETADSQQTAQAADSQQVAQTGDILSESQVKEIALKDAGVKETDVTGIRIKLETDDGVQEYEVDFYAGNKEYDYDIEAATGKIRSKDMDIDTDFRQNTSNTSAAVSEKEAVNIALKEVKGAVASDVRIHLDNDDGRQIYEGSILFNETEYDFEIDAATGAILEWEAESIYDD